MNIDKMIVQGFNDVNKIPDEDLKIILKYTANFSNIKQLDNEQLDYLIHHNIYLLYDDHKLVTFLTDYVGCYKIYDLYKRYFDKIDKALKDYLEVEDLSLQFVEIIDNFLRDEVENLLDMEPLLNLFENPYMRADLSDLIKVPTFTIIGCYKLKKLFKNITFDSNILLCKINNINYKLHDLSILDSICCKSISEFAVVSDGFNLNKEWELTFLLQLEHFMDFNEYDINVLEKYVIYNKNFIDKLRFIDKLKE